MDECMTCKTVGDLKRALEQFSDDTPLELMARIYGGDHGTYYTRVDRYGIPYGEGLPIEVYQDDIYCKIANEESMHLELD